MEDLQRLNMTLAWHVAALSRSKRLPKLESLLNPTAKQKRRRKFKRKSWQEIMAVCEANNAAFGGTVGAPAGDQAPPAGGAAD